jgi:hypothetical protein
MKQGNGIEAMYQRFRLYKAAESAAAQLLFSVVPPSSVIGAPPCNSKIRRLSGVS